MLPQSIDAASPVVFAGGPSAVNFDKLFDTSVRKVNSGHNIYRVSVKAKNENVLQATLVSTWTLGMTGLWHLRVWLTCV